MHFDRFLTLMYHNVVRDGGLRIGECARLSPSVTTYFLEESLFRDHLRMLSTSARILTMSDVEAFYWRRFNPQGIETPAAADQRPCALLTFDDGWSGCLEVATDPLREAKMQALMFVTINAVGTPGFSTWEELRNRDRDVWRIGSHSVHHGFLNEEPTRVIYRELRDSKRILEDQLEEPINTVSIPNGAVSDSVRAIAQDVGYSYVFTSEVWFNSHAVSPFDLGRIAIHSSTTAAQVEQWLKGRIRTAVWKRSFLQVAKFVLGPRRYRLFRLRCLGEADAQPQVMQPAAESAFEETALSTRGVP